MEELDELVLKLESIIDFQRVFLREVVSENEQLIAGLVTSQMERGETGEGTPIRPEYSPGYAAFKGFSTPDLKLTGAFHASVYADAEQDDIIIDATDSKRGQLTAKYGENILSLQERNIDRLNEAVIIPEMQRKNERYFQVTNA